MIRIYTCVCVYIYNVGSLHSDMEIALNRKSSICGAVDDSWRMTSPFWSHLLHVAFNLSLYIQICMSVCLSACLPGCMYVCIYICTFVYYMYIVYIVLYVCIICLYYMYTRVYIYISYIYIIVFAVTFQTGSRRGSQYRPCCTAPCSSKLKHQRG